MNPKSLDKKKTKHVNNMPNTGKDLTRTKTEWENEFELVFATIGYIQDGHEYLRFKPNVTPEEVSKYIQDLLSLADKPKETEQCFCQSYIDDEGKMKDCTCGKCADSLLKSEERHVKDGVILKNAEWLENLGVVLNFYRRIGKYDKKWIARLGNPTCLEVLKIEAETLPKLLSMIEDELFAVRNPKYMDKGGGSRAPEGNVSSVQDGIPSTNVHLTPLKTEPGWEEDFDNLFGEKHHLVCEGKKCECKNVVKDFIRSLLSSERQRLIEEIEGIIPEYLTKESRPFTNRDNREGWNKAINDFRQKLSALRKEEKCPA